MAVAHDALHSIFARGGSVIFKLAGLFLLCGGFVFAVASRAPLELLDAQEIHAGTVEIFGHARKVALGCSRSARVRYRPPYRPPERAWYLLRSPSGSSVGLKVGRDAPNCPFPLRRYHGLHEVP